MTHNGPDSLSPGNLELGLRNSFWTQVYPKHAKFGVWGSLILPCYGEQSREREKLAKHIKGRNIRLSGLQIPCDNAPSLLVTPSPLLLLVLEVLKYYMQPKIFSA